MNKSIKKQKLSVVLATRNEEKNIARCLKSVANIADEIVVLDEYSTDRTREVAMEYGARVFLEPHHDNFHITKQKVLEKATGDWILQLDADEVVTPELASEITSIINMTDEKIKRRFNANIVDQFHFIKHQRLIERRDGKIGKPTGKVVAFFVPRLNYFLGKALKHGGVYPDGVIRLVKRGEARFPQKSVHEQMIIEGEVSWLFNPLTHYDSPTLSRYLERFNRYTDLYKDDLKSESVSKNIFSFASYLFIKPALTFLNIYLRHKGFLDGARGFLWAAFSSFRHPIAYFKYLLGKEEAK